MSMQEQDSLERERQALDVKYVVPSSKNKLRACLRCHLIKTQDQWKTQLNCENCGSIKNGDEKKRTTEKFQNIVSMLQPSVSWLRRKIKLLRSKLVSGAYAVVVHH